MHNSVRFSIVTRLNWHIKYSADNCKVVHVRKCDPSFTHKIMSSELTVASQEKGFGAMIENFHKNIISDLIIQNHKSNERNIRKELEAR